MKYAARFLMFIAITPVQAQDHIELFYTSSGSLKMIELPSNNLLTGFAAGMYGTGFTRFSAQGDVLGSSSFWGGGQLYSRVLMPSGFKKVQDNLFYFSSGYVDGNCGGHGRVYPIIGRMDSIGHISSLNWYDVGGCPYFTRDLTVTNDYGAITWGLDQLYALKVDSNLAHVWSRYFNRAGRFQFIRELPGGDLLAGINMDTAGAVVARMTAAGEFLWCRSYFRPSGLVHDCLVESDSSFVVIGVTDDVASAGQQEFMLKLNGAGDVQWCRGYANGQGWAALTPSRIVPTPDGQRLVLATGFASDTRPILMKFDQNGDTLWTRSAGVDGYDYETGDLLVHSDGGILFSGAVYGSLPDMNTGLAFLFKADSLGHLPCSGRQPQPIGVTDLFPTDSSFVFTSVDGAVAHAITVSDTTFAPIVVYDGCVITNAPSSQRAYERIRIRPNPTTGRFSMSFPHPLQAESFYSVYDVSGKLLYQRPLPSGSSAEEVDLSGYGKGTYVIRFTSPEEVCFERVVVE